MFRNYLIVALRNLRRQKVYTIINVFGLALAIACAVLIYSFVRSEMTYDTFHAGYQNIYRVTSVVHFREMEQWDSTPFPLATVIVLAGLTTIPRDVLDQAAVDGAGFWRTLFQIKIPLLLPIISIAILFGMMRVMTTTTTPMKKEFQRNVR